MENMPLGKMPTEWMLSGEPWIEYRVRRDLLLQNEDESEVKKARSAMLQDQRIQTLVQELANWPGEVLASHRSSSQDFHTLVFLADIGMNIDDPGISIIVDQILKHQSAEGPFQLRMNIPEHFGGSGNTQWAWALCDAPLTVYALQKFGLGNEPSVVSARHYLAELIRANGWPCAVSNELGKFRGPGKKDDPCPFATLAMLKALSVVDEFKDSDTCRIGAAALLELWEASKEKHPYMFFMGTDFRKLKVPFIWYDLMHILDVLSRFHWLKNDARFVEMIDVMKHKANSLGQFTAESIWKPWSEWEFGQKKTPSRWLTFSAWRILKRVEA